MEWNPFCRNTCVVPSNIILDGYQSPVGRGDFVIGTPSSHRSWLLRNYFGLCLNLYCCILYVRQLVTHWLLLFFIFCANDNIWALTDCMLCVCSILIVIFDFWFCLDINFIWSQANSLHNFTFLLIIYMHSHNLYFLPYCAVLGALYF